ncbi:MAG: Gfo/Idh/MocA family oxidoreductase [Eubacterium sp.]|nr:Gfo/Idh/MocA family oxidoreductase [Eubacterium sp.]
MKYALIGCGRIASNHIAAAKMNQLEIVAICDIDKEKAQALKDKFSLSDQVMIYTDYEQMLQCIKPELVAIATESGKHAQIALTCINHNCNLIIEKPIALSLEDADEIIRLSNIKNVKVCACHQNRFNKSIQKIREVLEQGKFGRLYHGVANIRWNREQEYYKQAPWRGTWDQDGGALMNQCIHNIDLLRWMMGDEVETVIGVTDQLKHDYLEAEDIGIAIVQFKNGSYGIIEGTTNIYQKNFEETLYLFGEKGVVKAGGKSVNRIEEWIFSEDENAVESIKSNYSEDPPNIYGFGHNPLYTDMIGAVRDDREPYVNAEAGRRALELVLAIYQSSKTGKSVHLPMERCSTAEFKGLFDKKEG